jgi:hypothetical protein
VNTSARLMSYTQSHFGGGVLVDDATYRSCCDRLLFEKLDPIELKGKNRRVQVYRPTIYDGKTKSMLNMRIREDRFLMVNRLYKEQRVLYAASLRRRLLTSDSSRREFRKQALTPKDAKQMFMIASDRMPVKIMRMVCCICVCVCVCVCVCFIFLPLSHIRTHTDCRDIIEIHVRVCLQGCTTIKICTNYTITVEFQTRLRAVQSNAAFKVLVIVLVFEFLWGVYPHISETR